jgi:hypothetical protein
LKEVTVEKEREGLKVYNPDTRHDAWPTGGEKGRPSPFQLFQEQSQ